MKKLFIFFFILFNSILNAQNDSLEKVIIEFNRFKYPDTKYYIDFKKNEVQCVMKYKISDDSDKIILDKTYKFSDEQVINFKNELDLNIPDSIIHKSEDAFDGGGFIIDFFRKNGNTSAASIPLAMDILLEKHPEMHGKLALLIGYGAGLVYAGQVVQLPPAP